MEPQNSEIKNVKNLLIIIDNLLNKRFLFTKKKPSFFLVN